MEEVHQVAEKDYENRTGGHNGQNHKNKIRKHRKSDTTWNSWADMGSLTINIGATLTIACEKNIDGENVFASGIDLYDGEATTGKYRILPVGDGELGLTIGGESADFDVERDFTTEEAISFSITGEVYKVIVVSDDSENVLEGTDGAYSYTPQSGSYFEIKVYTDEDAYKYDTCQPGENEFSVEYQVYHRDDTEFDESNTIAYNVEVSNTASYGTWTKLILANTVTEVSLTIHVKEGYTYDATMYYAEGCNGVTDIVRENNNVLVWKLNAEDRGTPEICFYKEGESGGGESGDGSTDDMISYIENQEYAFGDWDEDNDVDTKDLKLIIMMKQTIVGPVILFFMTDRKLEHQSKLKPLLL